MGLITFRKDIVQSANIQDLYNVKVNKVTYDAAMNDIDTRITTLRSDMETGLSDAKTYTDNAVAGLLNGQVTDNKNAIAILNADATTDGSVDKKIQTAITGIINGAPEAYDTLKELLDLINADDTDLNGLITQLNDKVDAVVGAATTDWNTLEKIENQTKALDAATNARIDAADSQINDINKSFPVYKFDNELSISSDDKITLSLVPYGDIMSSRAVVYSTDDNGNITIEGIYTCAHDTDDTTGKVYIIDAGSDDITAYKASVEYFSRAIDNQ